MSLGDASLGKIVEIEVIPIRQKRATDTLLGAHGRKPLQIIDVLRRFRELVLRKFDSALYQKNASMVLG